MTPSDTDARIADGFWTELQALLKKYGDDTEAHAEHIGSKFDIDRAIPIERRYTDALQAIYGMAHKLGDNEIALADERNTSENLMNELENIWATVRPDGDMGLFDYPAQVTRWVMQRRDELTAARERERALREALEDIARDGDRVGITAVVITAKRVLLELAASDSAAHEGQGGDA